MNDPTTQSHTLYCCFFAAREHWNYRFFANKTSSEWDAPRIVSFLVFIVSNSLFAGTKYQIHEDYHHFPVILYCSSINFCINSSNNSMHIHISYLREETGRLQVLRSSTWYEKQYHYHIVLIMLGVF
jgi:hypothetical protein